MHIPAYKAFLAVGCVAGVLVGALTRSGQSIGAPRFALIASGLLVPALIGARLWFIFIHWRFFRTRPRASWERGSGGSSLYGGLVLAVAVSVALLPLAGVDFWSFWDAASLTMLVGLFFTRFGCLINGCCQGRPTSGRLGIRLPDERGRWERRIPTQLLEAGWAAMALALALEIDGRLPFEGFLFVVVVGGYAGLRLVLEHTRASAAGRRANVAASTLLLVASLCWLAVWSA